MEISEIILGHFLQSKLFNLTLNWESVNSAWIELLELLDWTTGLTTDLKIAPKNKVLHANMFKEV